MHSSTLFSFFALLLSVVSAIPLPKIDATLEVAPRDDSTLIERQDLTCLLEQLTNPNLKCNNYHGGYGKRDLSCLLAKLTNPNIDCSNYHGGYGKRQLDLCLIEKLTNPTIDCEHYGGGYGKRQLDLCLIEKLTNPTIDCEHYGGGYGKRQDGGLVGDVVDDATESGAKDNNYGGPYP